MNSISSIALSAMNTAMLGMGAAAHNVANLQTDGFRRQFVVRQAQADGGVTASVALSSQSGNSPADDVVQQLTAGYLFKANLLSLQTEQRVLGTLLDIEA